MMDRKKLIIIICTGILFLALIGFLVIANKDNDKTDETDKQELSVEESEDVQQGLKEEEKYEETEENSINFSDIVDGNTSSGNTSSDNTSSGNPTGSDTTEGTTNGGSENQKPQEQEFGEIIEP